jgi:hypothetical protein
MAAGVAACGAIGGVRPAEAQAANPLGKDWWPSLWGAEDEVGASQRITPAKVLEATKLIKAGKVYRLGMNLRPGIPLFGQRHRSITIPDGPSAGSSDFLFKRFDMLGLKIVADAAHYLPGRQQASGFDNGALAVDPVGLQRVQPGALDGQAAEQEPKAPVLLGPLIVCPVVRNYCLSASVAGQRTSHYTAPMQRSAGHQPSEERQ